jgi:hypothetical protein
MIVPGHDPRAAGVHAPQVLVVPVLAVAEAVVRQARAGLVSDVPADPAFVRCALVNIVAQVEDKVQVVLGHVLIGSEESLFVVLTRGECEAQSLGHGPRRRHRARATDATGCVAATESIPVPVIRLQVLHQHVDRMSQVGLGDHRALVDDMLHLVVAGHFPVHIDVLVGHAAVRLLVLGRQARPDHDRIIARITGCDPQRIKGVVLELDLFLGLVGGSQAKRGDGGQRRGVRQPQSPRDPAVTTDGIAEVSEVEHGVPRTRIPELRQSEVSWRKHFLRRPPAT